MKPTQQLHDLGQSLWLDNMTRGILNDGTLRRYIGELSVTGLTSNPTIFDHAIKEGDAYDDAIRKAAEGISDETLFFELAIEDLRRAADLFRPVHDRTGGVDGWVSLEVSPLLADDTAGTIRAAAQLHGRAQRPNLFIKIPGTPDGCAAIEESIFGGVPVNVTLLFSATQVIAAAQAYMRGLERRLGVKGALRPDGGDAEAVLAEFKRAGVDETALAARLQREGAASFDASWKDLLDRVAARRAMLAQRAAAGKS